MSSIESQLRAAWFAKIQAAWPEITDAQLHLSQDFRRFNLENDLASGLLTLPLVVAGFGRRQTAVGYGGIGVQSYIYPATAYYIIRTDDARAKLAGTDADPAYDYVALLEDRMEQLRDSYMAGPVAGDVFQSNMEEPQIDVSEANLFNDRVLNEEAPFWAAEITTNLYTCLTFS